MQIAMTSVRGPTLVVLCSEASRTQRNGIVEHSFGLAEHRELGSERGFVMLARCSVPISQCIRGEAQKYPVSI